MKVRIKQVPSFYSGLPVWRVEIWRWYVPFWTYQFGELREKEAIEIARLIAAPTTVNIK